MNWFFRLEALSAAISEKDAHIALLEMSGIRNGQTSDEIDRLKSQKRFLVEKIKTEVRSGIISDT